jgi:hypothetical protein
MLAEYGTLMGPSSHKTPPSCFGCGQTLYELNVVVSQDSVEFTYTLKNKGGNPKKEYCSMSCEQYYGELVEAATTASASPSGGFYLNGVEAEDKADEFMREEIQHFGGLLQSVLQKGNEGGTGTAAAVHAADRLTVTACEFIKAGTILLNTPGVLADRVQGEQGASKGELSLEKFGLDSLLLVDNRSLFHSLEWSTDPAQCNAALVSQYSMLRAEGSPYSKDSVISAGSFVVVAEKNINQGDKIFLQPLEVDEQGHRMLPLPIDALTEGMMIDSDGSEQPSQGIPSLRVPADLPFSAAEDSDHEQPARKQQGAAVPDPASLALEKMISHAPASLQFALRQYVNAGHNQRELLMDSLVVFRGRALFLKDIEDDGIQTAVQALRDKRSRRPVNLNTSDISRKEVEEKDFPEFTEKNPLFDPDSDTFMGDQLDIGTEELCKRHSKIVNRPYLQSFHAFLSSPKSRKRIHDKEDSELAHRNEAAAAVCLSSCSQLFDTLPLDDEDHPASVECLQGWALALKHMLVDPALHQKLQQVKAKLKDDGDFYPAVVLKSLDAMLYQIVTLIRTSLQHAVAELSVSSSLTCCFCVLCTISFRSGRSSQTEESEQEEKA